jgi:4-aminobutyrate aminotransferase-like enzyme/Ser/Thr protein kinase RdoA (MazF antagonist)
MSLSTLLLRSAQAAPRVTAEQARALLARHYGLDARVEPLGSQQDLNFRVSVAAAQYVLKIGHADAFPAELHAQHDALSYLGAAGLPVPTPIPALDGQTLLTLALDGQPLFARLLHYIEGQPLTRCGTLSPALVGELGRTCARVDRALASFTHPGLERSLQWDPRHAGAWLAGLGPLLDGSARQAEALARGAQACERLRGLAERLPMQAIHLDITDDNTLWARDAEHEWQLRGIIDFGDLVRTWRVAELAVTCAALLHHAAGDPFAVLPAVSAYHALNPLSEAEAAALWPLVVARAAVLVLSSEQQLQVDPDNTYVSDNLCHEWQIFDVASSVPCALMDVAIAQAIGLPLAPATLGPMLPLLPELALRAPVIVDLGVLSEHYRDGNWACAGIDQRLLAEQAGADSVAMARYGEYRLSQTRVNCATPPATCALHVELHFPAKTLLQAPFAGTLHCSADGALHVLGSDARLVLHGARALSADRAALRPGQPLAECMGSLRVQVVRSADISPPLFCSASHAPAWMTLCVSPEPLLGVACEAPQPADAGQLLARREASFARSQKHYYPAPPQIERGWRNQLIDLHGRSYLDMLNNVAVLGHGHPRMAQVASRQWSLLNTNSRFHYAAIADFSERLLALAPAGMDRVFLVNSGTEANDLAIRLAWAWRGGRDMLCVLEAYHGWSVATDAVSTSIADNPEALHTRPEWVHPVLAPNTYRGRYRGADSTAAYLADVEASLARLVSSGRPLAGFICEPVYGNAGGIALPPGYLRQVYARVRAAGGLCIADEVQVGYGRLGEYFWGFEEQGVVPDIITLAKGMGNGHPLGAVITRREVAEALEAQGYFFSSAGASPVSCQVGLAVLDVMAEERLWQRAREVGGYFKARLQALLERFPLVGAVHGSGFYLGLELVSDRDSLAPATAQTARLCERLLSMGIFMQPTGDHLNILKIKPPMVTDRDSVDFFVDSVARILAEDL